MPGGVELDQFGAATAEAAFVHVALQGETVGGLAGFGQGCGAAHAVHGEQARFGVVVEAGDHIQHVAFEHEAEGMDAVRARGFLADGGVVDLQLAFGQQGFGNGFVDGAPDFRREQWLAG